MEQSRFRCHISIIFGKIGGLLAIVILLLLNNIEDVVELVKNGKLLERAEGARNPLLIVPLILGVLILYLAYSMNHWYKTWIIVDEKSITIEQNTLIHKVNTIGIENISNVNLQQNLLQKLYHAYGVKLDTNSATTSDSTDVHIVLKEDKAFWFRDTIRRSLGREVEEDAQWSAEKQERTTGQSEMVKQTVQSSGLEEHPTVRYHTLDLLKYCLYNMSIFTALFTAALTIFVIMLAVWKVTQVSFWPEVESITGSFLVILLLWAGMVYSLFAPVVRFYGFTVTRREKELKVGYGFFNHREYLIPMEKITALQMSQGIIARITKHYSVELICIGFGDDEKECAQILLGESSKKLQERMHLLLPEYEQELLTPGLAQPKSARYHIFTATLKMAVFVGCVATGISLAVPQAIVWIGTGAGICILWTLLCQILSYHVGQLGHGSKGIMITTGYFTRRSICVDYNKIQSLKTSQSILAKHFGLCKGEVVILASALKTNHETRYFAEAEFEEIHKKLLEKKVFDI